LTIASSIFFVGCGAKQEPSGTVTGTVTLKGEPITEGEVNFAMPSKGTAFRAKLDGQGNFAFEGKMPLGKYIVCVTPPVDETPPGLGTDPANMPPPAKVPETDIPAKYHNEAVSKLRETVIEGANKFTIKLEP